MAGFPEDQIPEMSARLASGGAPAVIAFVAAEKDGGRRRQLWGAKDCIRWRDELGKPAGARFMAWWARGAHELSLGRASDAATSFERALEFARKAAVGAPAAVEPGGDFGVILAAGYMGLATR